MKRTISALILFLLIFGQVFSFVGAEFENPAVTDEAGYLSESQLGELTRKLDDIRNEYDFEVAIVTEYEMSSGSAMASADDIYDYNGYGAGANDDGILFYICSSRREYHITTHADGLRVFNENGIEYMKKNIEPYLEDGEYYLAMERFAELADELLAMARNGEPFNKKQYDLTTLIMVIGAAILVPLIIAWFMTSNQLSKMKTAVENDYAANYIKPGSKRLDISRDIFLYSHLTKTEKEKKQFRRTSFIIGKNSRWRRRKLLGGN